MAEPHAHLDKALTAEKVPNPRGDLLGAIDAWMTAASAGLFTAEATADRAAAARALLLADGAAAGASRGASGSAGAADVNMSPTFWKSQRALTSVRQTSASRRADMSLTRHRPSSK